MQRVVVLGRGGAGKSTVARRLSELVGLPVIELDKHFWQPGLAPLSREKWVEVQRKLASRSRWIMDGDLGPYDALPVLLSKADTVLLLDFPLWLCLWRALRRDRENWDFWWWLITWGCLERPKIRDMLAEHSNAQVHILHSQKELDQFLSKLAPPCCSGKAVPLWKLYDRDFIGAEADAMLQSHAGRRASDPTALTIRALSGYLESPE
jgi:hypothetical protein